MQFYSFFEEYAFGHIVCKIPLQKQRSSNFGKFILNLSFVYGIIGFTTYMI